MSKKVTFTKQSIYPSDPPIHLKNTGKGCHGAYFTCACILAIHLSALLQQGAHILFLPVEEILPHDFIWCSQASLKGKRE